MLGAALLLLSLVALPAVSYISLGGSRGLDCSSGPNAPSNVKTQRNIVLSTQTVCTRRTIKEKKRCKERYTGSYNDQCGDKYIV